MTNLSRLFSELCSRTDYEQCRRPRAARFSLEPMMALMSALGNPHLQVPAIHVAGSKGKGSVAYCLSWALRAAATAMATSAAVPFVTPASFSPVAGLVDAKDRSKFGRELLVEWFVDPENGWFCLIGVPLDFLVSPLLFPQVIQARPETRSEID